jgi:nucleoside-diphosphate-sugar epimerase
VKILVTGGAGFIGSNLSNYYLNKDCEVTVFDNLSRKGTEKNLEWLKSNHKKKSKELIPSQRLVIAGLTIQFICGNYLNLSIMIL